MLRSLLLLLCMISIARAQSPRDTLIFMGESYWLMKDFQRSPDLQLGLATAVMRWFVDDGEWSDALDGVDLTVALQHCGPCRADPATRQAVLALAEQMRQSASRPLQLFYAYTIARAFRYAPGDPFASVADESRVLRLSLDETRRQLDAGDAARFPAMARAFAAGEDRRLVSAFEALSGPTWPAQVRGLLVAGDIDAPTWMEAKMLIMLRGARAAYMGLAPYPGAD